ncbi:hypothetical protein MMC30_004879 [Trapelia coarctata]|nr:hypothetical protein [Trapelia coarctata]
MAVYTILTDILILCMPIRQVWKLQLSQRSRIALTFIFLMGGLVCIASVVRVTTLFQVEDEDLTYSLVGIANWSSIEFALAVISASLPTLRPLLLHLTPKSWKSTANQSSGSAPPNSKELSRRKEEFRRLRRSGTEAYALHELPGDLESGSRGSDMKEGIMVTSAFSTTSSR